MQYGKRDLFYTRTVSPTAQNKSLNSLRAPLFPLFFSLSITRC